MDVLTETVHFYVQRNTSFSTASAIVPFELSRLNEGGAMDLTSGIFTAPVPGIYHFGFSGVSDSSSNGLGIFLQLNGENIGIAVAGSGVTAFGTLSLTASVRLKANDRVNLYKDGNNGHVLHEYGNYHYTHFTGWLVEEDL